MVRLRNVMLATTALMPLGVLAAAANPLGSQVVGGTANVQGQGTPTVTVTQSTDRAIINWQAFNIGAGEATRFVQPGASSVTLNRVIGGLGVSAIDGTLTANGRVFLVNPDGILFGANAKVNTGSFLATTNDIRNADFMAGRYQFNIPGRPDASIVNLGTITAQNGGFAALVAPGLRNAGTITANLGTVGLAASNSFTLDFYGDRLITLGVNDSIAARVIDVATGQPLNALVKNEGKLKANGGRVELTAAAARQVVDAVINNTGVIEANSIGSRNGMIVLGAATRASKPTGGPAQTVRVSGTLSAAGKRKGTKGGTVVVTGENIELAGATINASGRAGGGRVLIGGDVGGGQGNPAVANNSSAALESFAVPAASMVNVDAATTIETSAGVIGNGGKVVVWSNQATTFYGTISARGGRQAGNGGFVETSGHQSLSFSGVVNTGAPQGTNGTLLLDPQDALITTNAGAGIITVSSIQAALANGDVFVTTGSSGTDPGDITVAAPVSWTSHNTLTLNAANNIAINADIGGINGGLTVSAASSGTVGSITATASINVGIFMLQAGAWNQVALNLPGFFAKDFQIRAVPGSVGPSFLRALLGNGTTASPYLITDIYGLQGASSPALLSSHFSLANNIDAGGTSNWNGGSGFIPIGNYYNNFAGLFDGFHHNIKDLFVGAAITGAAGLFGSLGPTATIRNVNLQNATIHAIADSNWTVVSIGALAGVNNGGTIVGSSVTGNVSGMAGGNGWVNVGGLVGENLGSIATSHSEAGVTAGGQFAVAGGLVGWNANLLVFDPSLNQFVPGLLGTIFQSYATGSVSVIATNVQASSGTGGANVGGLVGLSSGGGIDQSFATGAVSATGNVPPGVVAVGGLVGQLSDSLSHSFASGTVFGGQGSWTGGLVGYSYAPISQSYSIGAVSGAGTSGGLVGYQQPTFAVTNSYWNTKTSGQSNSPAGTPAATSQLTASLSSIGFDNAVWNIDPGITYPYLLWQPANTRPLVPTSNPTPTSTATPTPILAAPIIVSLQSRLPPGTWPFPTGQVTFLTPSNTQLASVAASTSPLPNFETITGQNVSVQPYAPSPNFQTIDGQNKYIPPYGTDVALALAGTLNPDLGTPQWVPFPGGTKQDFTTWIYDQNRAAGQRLLQESVNTYAPISSMTFKVGGSSRTIFAFANADADGTSDHADGLFQCTALVSQYLAALGFTSPGSLLDGRDVASGLAKKYPNNFQFSAGKYPPAVGSIISMEAGSGGVANKTGHVAIVKGLQYVDDHTLKVTLIENNMSLDGGKTYAVDRTMTFTKGANNLWSSSYTTGYTYAVVDWTTPTLLPYR